MKNYRTFPRSALALPARLRAAGQSPWLPLALLLLALSAMFLFGNDRGAFYRPGHHNFLSAQSMTLAANLSPEHNFLMHFREIPDAAGNVAYDPYNRFPLGTYALIKLAILPFGSDLSAQIYAARLLMLSFFAATAVLAYLSLVRLGGDRWIALGATALTFASTYCLYYNDMVSTEVTSLFGVLLVFHGMTLFAQEGRFGQLALKSCVALLLGWHIYALLLPFIILGLVKEILRARPAAERAAASWLAPWLTALRRGLIAFLTGPHFRLGLIALAFGLLVLGFNLFNEYRASDGEVPLRELPTVGSILYRTGLDDEFWSWFPEAAEHLAWPAVIRGQFASIGIMSAPFALPGYASIFDADNGWNRGLGELQSLYMGIGVFAASLAGLWFLAGQRLLVATWLSAGWFWVLPFRRSAFTHDFEALFHIGIPLVFFLTLLLLVRKSDRRWSCALAVMAALALVFASFQASRVGPNPEDAAFQSEILADFEAIRGITDGRIVFIDSGEIEGNFTGVPRAVDYYLAGSLTLYAVDRERRALADYLLLPRPAAYGPALLTPENRWAFLYDRLLYDGAIDQILAAAGEPAARGDFDLYLHENRLIYFKKPCVPADIKEAFLLHFIPADTGDLPPERRAVGFANRDFYFTDYSVAVGDRCIAVTHLPEYPLVAIRTGQYTLDSPEPLWQREFPVK